jgi:tetratricopeptide (TPR) repeat protein
VFQIQEDIARAITTSLRMPLGLKPGENLVNDRNIDPDSYAQYLRARAIFTSRQLADDPLQAPQMAISILEQVTSRSPSYAPAWVKLAAAYSRIAEVHGASSTESLAESRAAIGEVHIKEQAAVKRAVELDPADSGPYTMQALMAWTRGKFIEADAAFQKSLLLSPDPEQLTAYADRLADAGYVKEALPLAEKAHAADPLSLQPASITVLARWLNGDDAGAIALAKALPPAVGANFLTGIYASQGHFQEAADALAQIVSDAGSPQARIVELLRKRPAAIAPESLPAAPPRNLLNFVYPSLGAWDRSIATYERSFDTGSLGGRGFSWVWHPSNAPARRSEQFKRVVRKIGLVDFWRAKGWPPQCHPTTGDDFVCS